MATPLKVLRYNLNKASGLFHWKWKAKNGLYSVSKRYLLSQAYSCSEAWSKYLKESSLSDISLSELAVQIHEQLDKTGKASRVDLSALVHQFNTLDGDEEEADFMEEILASYNRCQESFPPSASISHAIVRCYVQAGLAERLLPLLSGRLTYGIFPNSYTLNFLLDHFIKQDNFAAAAELAYLSTMQEDFSNHLNALLSLEAVVQHLSGSNVEDLAPPPKEASDSEEDWVKVKYIQYPYYDDHFAIKDQRFLLGKTMMMLAKVHDLGLPNVLTASLKLMGAGLYHKFDQGLSYLTDMTNTPDVNISQEALDYFHKSLNSVQSRDADEPEVEIALRTVDDEIHRLLPTHEEKENYLAAFGNLQEKLVSNNRLVADLSLQTAVHEFVVSNVQRYEMSEIESQLAAFDSWASERDADVEKQIFEMRKVARIKDMKQKLQELQAKEELLNYFDMEEDIRLKFLEEDQESDPRLTVTKLE